MGNHAKVFLKIDQPAAKEQLETFKSCSKHAERDSALKSLAVKIKCKPDNGPSL